MNPSPIDRNSREPLPVPYLDHPPPVIPLGIGRQLLVDDYLIERTTLTRTFHAAKLHSAAPVLVPQSALEMNGGRCPVAAPFNDGVWYDPDDDLFKLWYHAGWFDGTALATSRDGLQWERPVFDVAPGTNAVIAPRPGYRRDGGLVWLDHDAPPTERYKMFLFFRWSDGQSGEIYTSSDGIHWRDPIPTSPCGDNSSFFYNAHRKRFVFSIRESWGYRARAYHEAETFHEAAHWQSGEQIPWARVDRLDQPDPLVGDEPQLYDVNAIAYESLLLGTFAIFYGPQNPVCARTGQPKLIDLQLAYSRDGFYWHRPDRTAFIPSSRTPGTWNSGYIHAAGGICLVMGDELWFYFGAFSGQSPTLAPGETGNFEQENAMYAGGSTGLATLRRDGFASLDADEEFGELITRPLTFQGSHLFINIDNPRGICQVEVLDEAQNVIAPYTLANCVSLQTDSTKARVQWQSAGDLSMLAGQPVRLRFRLRKSKLYAFWVSSKIDGRSGGFVAAGGPGFAGNRDQ